MRAPVIAIDREGCAPPDFSPYGAQFDPPGSTLGFLAQSLEIVVGLKACDDNASSIAGQGVSVSGRLTTSR
jgi:hypothetical protein